MVYYTEVFCSSFFLFRALVPSHSHRLVAHLGRMFPLRLGLHQDTGREEAIPTPKTYVRILEVDWLDCDLELLLRPNLDHEIVPPFIWHGISPARRRSEISRQ